MADALDARWGFMRAWCALLEGKLVVKRSSRLRIPIDQFEGLEVSLPTRRSREMLDDLRRIRHALALLALVEHVDQAAWRWLLTEFCELDMEEYEDLLQSEQFRSRFVFDIYPTRGSWDDDDMWPADILEQFAHSNDEDAQMVFAATAQHIAQVAAEDGQILGEVEIPLKVRFVVSIVGTDADDEIFASYAQRAWGGITAAMSEPGSNRFPATPGDEDTTVPKCVFVLSRIWIDDTGRELSSASLNFVDGIVRANIGPADLDLALNTNVSRYSVRKEDYGSLLRNLLCTAPPSRPVVEDVYLSLQNVTTLQLMQLSSAIAAARSPKHLMLSVIAGAWGPVKRRWLWKMIAYALFSKHSSSSVTHFTLTLSQARITTKTQKPFMKRSRWMTPPT